jgi:rare lipoprotein A
MTIKTLAAGVLATLVFHPLSAVAGGDNAFKQKGIASYYADRFQGRKTASGVRYDKGALTAAHKTLPLGTKVRVTNLNSGESVDVEINDRGPHVKGRVVDLSKAAARELGMTGAGLVKVQVEVIEAANDA